MTTLFTAALPGGSWFFLLVLWGHIQKGRAGVY